MIGVKNKLLYRYSIQSQYFLFILEIGNVFLIISIFFKLLNVCMINYCSKIKFNY